MALTTFQPAHLCNGQLFDTIFLGKLGMYLFIIFIATHLNVRCAVTFYTPTHGKGGMLGHDLHLLNGAVTGLTCYPGNGNVLRMVKISEVGKVMYPDPFYRFPFPCIFLVFLIPSYGRVQFLDLARIKFIGIPIGQVFLTWAFRIALVFTDRLMTVHTNVKRRDTGSLGNPRGRVAILTIDLVVTGMDLMGIMYRLDRGITLIYAHLHQPTKSKIGT